MLTGMRRAALVPVENLVFSVLKIALLLLAAAVAVPGGIALSWVLSVALIVVGVNGWLLARGLPRFGAAAADRALPISHDGRSDGFAVLDVMTFLLTSEAVARRTELGPSCSTGSPTTTTPTRT